LFFLLGPITFCGKIKLCKNGYAQDWALQDWTMTDECVGIRGVIPEEEKEGCGGNDLQKVLSLE